MKHLLFIPILLLSNFLLSQCCDDFPNYKWGVEFGGNSQDAVTQMVVDEKDDIVVVGIFRQDLIIGSFNFQSIGVLSDIFLSKLNKAGDLIWIKTIFGPGTDYVEDVIVDDEGFIYLTGTYAQSLTFNSTSINVTNSGAREGFIAKYDSDGNFIWVKKISGYASTQSLAIDSNKDIYVAGRFEFTVDFGLLNLTSNGNLDNFLAKYDHDGNVLWATHIGGPDDDYNAFIATSTNNEILLASTFHSQIDLGNYSFSSNGHQDLLISKWTSNGDLLFAKHVGGPGFDNWWDVDFNPQLNTFFLGGNFTEAIDLDGQNLVGHGDANMDALIIEMDSDGNILWADGFGGSEHDILTHLHVNSTTLFCYGQFVSPDFDFHGNLANSGNSGVDLFLSTYDLDGSPQCLETFGEEMNDQANGIDEDSEGNLYIGGYYSGNLILDTVDLDNIANGIEGFLVQWESVSALDIEVELGEDMVLCHQDSFLLDPMLSDQFNIIWSNGSTASTLTVMESGLYWIDVEKDNCTAIDTIEIIFFQSDEDILGADTSICETQTMLLEINPLDYDEILWQDGSNGSTFLIESTGSYSIDLRVKDCWFSDTIVVDQMDCPECIIRFPNVFTPDSDGLNDFFYPFIEFCEIEEFQLRVFNRWGKAVFDSNSIDFGWDGYFDGKPALIDTYVWWAKFRLNGSEKTETRFGELTLIR